MIIDYIKNVSKMLWLIDVARENSTELHLAVERSMLPKCFPFNHPNYCRYLTAHHVNLSALSIQNGETWEDFLANGFGDSMSGETFSTIHGDLITEATITGEVKVRSGPMHGGYSSSEKTSDLLSKPVCHGYYQIKTERKIDMCSFFCTWSDKNKFQNTTR